jgi:hypothetical protein
MTDDHNGLLRCETCGYESECRFSYTDETMLEHYFCTISCLTYWLFYQWPRIDKVEEEMH